MINSFGNQHNKILGVTSHNTKPPAVSKQTENEAALPTDSTAEFSSLAATQAQQTFSVPTERTAPKEAAPALDGGFSLAPTTAARSTYSNSPLATLHGASAIDQNNEDQMHTATIETNTVFSTKLVGLSGLTRANLNPLFD